jgi:riboflavin synthase
MFTGIVEEIGTVNKISEGRLEIEASRVVTNLPPGGSISVNGVCLTVVSSSGKTFLSQVVPETLRKTNLGFLSPGNKVNLERPVSASGRLDGHIVQGHIDDKAKIVDISPDGEASIVTIKPSPSLIKYIAPKGYIAVDGTSLTVVDCGKEFFTITLIPYTHDHTVLGIKVVGDTVNIEVDILAKYVERLFNRREQ